MRSGAWPSCRHVQVPSCRRKTRSPLLQFSGTLELAALAPCTLIFSMGYIFNALSVATLR